MLANLVVCYLGVIACAVLAILSFLLLVHDLVDHLLLHCFYIWIDSCASVEILIELLPYLVFDFGLVASSLVAVVCIGLFLLLPTLSLLFDCTNKDELDRFKLQRGVITY